VHAVHRDIHALLNAGVLRKTPRGAIVFPFDAIHLDRVEGGGVKTAARKTSIPMSQHIAIVGARRRTDRETVDRLVAMPGECEHAHGRDRRQRSLQFQAGAAFWPVRPPPATMLRRNNLKSAMSFGAPLAANRRTALPSI
jgi:hypothetical protein